MAAVIISRAVVVFLLLSLISFFGLYEFLRSCIIYFILCKVNEVIEKVKGALPNLENVGVHVKRYL